MDRKENNIGSDLIPYVVSDLVIADNCCNEVNFTCLDLSRFVNLRSIRIGSNCLNHVRSVLTEAVIHLESLIVGERSLMNAGDIEMSNSVDIEWVYEANGPSCCPSTACWKSWPS